MKLKFDITQEQFDKWLAALRSGEYMQGLSQLKYKTYADGYQHCCLGVLCEVLEFTQINGNNGTTFICGDGEEVVEELPLYLTSAFGTYTNSSGRLPKLEFWNDEQRLKFQDVRKFSEDDYHHTATSSLATLNDSGEFDFKRISEIIEAFFEPTK